MNEIGEAGTARSSVEHLATASTRPEWNLLLAFLTARCADQDEIDRKQANLSRVRSLPEQPVDWDAVLRLADLHGTASLLYQNLAALEGLVPAAVVTAARQSYERNVHKSLFLARELIRILDYLDV
ncbi:MAG: nucleotidyltransferase family protein, partial [Candidatus Sulfotelmatobacter sp.]